MSKNDAVIYYKHALTVATAVHAFRLYSCQDKLKNTGCLLKSQHKEGKERYCTSLAVIQVPGSLEADVFSTDPAL